MYNESGIMTDVTGEALIDEVKLRPAIWDTSASGHRNKDIRQQLWVDIALNFYPNLSETSAEILKVVSDIQKKWKNLRDTYTRWLKADLEYKTGKRDRPVRKYVHAKRLLFLNAVHLLSLEQEEQEEGGGEGGEAEEEEQQQQEQSDQEWEDTSQTQPDCWFEVDEKPDISLINIEPVDFPPKLKVGDKRKSNVLVIAPNSAEPFVKGNSKNKKVYRILPKQAETVTARTAAASTQSSMPKPSVPSGSRGRKKECDDIHFFKSLLPFVRSLPLSQKLKFRAHVMNDVMEYVEKIAEKEKNGAQPTSAQKNIFADSDSD